jgi:exosome complex RNA-binding protein Csl4
MEKYGVDEEEKTVPEKTGGESRVCPKCERVLVADTNVLLCPNCGTLPFERPPQ